MANIITVKSGSSTPTISDLEELELGFDKKEKKLYIRSNDEIIQIGTNKEEIINNAFPVGSIFITTKEGNPNEYLGGSWESFGPGKTLVGINANDENFNEAEKIGGTNQIDLSHTHTTLEHKLTISELPIHTHNISLTTNNDTHSHGISHTHGDTFSISTGGSHYHELIYKNGQKLQLNSGSSSNYLLSWTANKGTSSSYDTKTSTDGSHTHTINGSVSNYSGTSDSNSHNHSISGLSGQTGSGIGHTHGETSSALNTVSIQNPYITVYMWKRIA